MILMCYLVRKAEYSARTATLEAHVTMLQDSLTEKKLLIAALERKKQGKYISSFLTDGDSHSSLDCGPGVCDRNMQNTNTSTSASLFEEDDDLKFGISNVSEVLQNMRAYTNERIDLSTPRYPMASASRSRHIAIVVPGRPYFGH